MHSHGLNIEPLICHYGITDIHDIFLLEKAAALLPTEWVYIHDLTKQVRQCATLHILDIISRRLYHMEEYGCGLL